MGVLKAAERFDDARPVRFVTYAHDWIRQYMNRAIHNTGSTIRIPCGQHQNLRDGASGERTQLAGRALSIGHLDAPIGDDDASLLDLMPDGASPVDEEAHAVERDLRLALFAREALDTLSERERMVVTRRFLGDTPETYEAIAADIGYTRQGVDMIEARAMVKLRRALHVQCPQVLKLLVDQ